MLDRRLVEFTLGTKPSKFPGKDQRRSLFCRAVGDLLPSGDGESVKSETSTLMALQNELLKSHFDWAHHLACQTAGRPATTFVDPARIQAAVKFAVKSGRMRDLSGVSEAFGCYAIGAGRHN
jgi:hypothetical protein